MRRIFQIAVLILLSGCGTITKHFPMKLSDVHAGSCLHPVKALVVLAPAKGENVFKFEDILNTMGSTGNTIFTISNFKRAEFDYLLSTDSGPVIKHQIQDIFPENGTQNGWLYTNFNFYLTKTGIMSNELTLVMVSRLAIGEYKKTYAVHVTDSYSTFPVTYPSAKFLDTMLSTGVSQLKTDICKHGQLRGVEAHQATCMPERWHPLN